MQAPNSYRRPVNIKTAFLRLSSEERIIGICSLLLVITCFFPWFSGPPEDIPLTGNYEAASFNAFQNYGYILGYLTFFCALTTTALFMAHLFQFDKYKLPFNEHRLYVYLGEKMVLFHVIGVFLYTKMSFQYTDASVEFGVYIGLIASILTTVFGFFYYETQKLKQKRQKVQQQLEESFRERGYQEPELQESQVHIQKTPTPRPVAAGQNIYQRAAQNATVVTSHEE